MLVSELVVIYEFRKLQVDSPVSSSGTAWYFIIGENLRFIILNIVDFVDFFEDNFNSTSNSR